MEDEEIDVNEEQLTEILKGKIIEKVVHTYDKRFKSNAYLDGDNSEYTIIFSDGSSLSSWNSEWGGLNYRNKFNTEEK